MFGIFIFPVKPTDTSYPHKKDPKMPLKMRDDELLHFVKRTPKMTYFMHYKHDSDNLPIEEKLSLIERFLDKKYIGLKKMRGLENCYQTEDDEYYLRVIVNDKDFFQRYFN